tara:strand:- start:339 stop:1358 length:1020 start_codon:yes stop_codon:yes gene_type:complete
MSAYKQFNTQNLIVSPFEVNKGFLFIGGNALITPDVGIDRYLGANGGYLVSGSQLTGNIASQQIPKVLVYDSIKQLYYTNYLSGSRGFTQDAITSSILLGANREGDTIIGGIQQSNFYNYEQTTLWPNKDFPTSSLATSSVSVGVISIPSKLWGDYIQPNSFLLEGISGSIKDDGEGRLLWKLPSVGQNKYAYISGNIIYQHGIVTLFNPNEFGLDGEDFINSYITGNNVTMSFSSSYKLFETQYQVTINEDEFNYSLNPSSITGSEIPTKFSGSEIEWENTASIGKPLGFVTSSFFSPYITTVGLYNEDFELLAVGKLAQPLQSSQTTDTTILVNIDR